MSAAARPLPDVETPWMTAETCAAYMNFPSLRAFYKFLSTPEGRELPRGHVNRALRFDRRIVDAYVAGLLPRSKRPTLTYRRVSQRAKRPVVSRELTLVHDAKVLGGADER